MRKTALIVLALVAAILLVACGAKTTTATDITQTSAKLHAQVSWKKGEQGAYWFEYRRAGTTTWTDTTHHSWGPMGNDGGPIDLPQNVSGLTAATTYDYRYCGTIGTSSEVCFDTLQFTTQSAPSGCSLSATPANFNAQVAAATAGQTICLAAGNYGTWTGTSKAITIKGTSGSLMQFNFGSGDANFTVDGVQGAQGSINAGTSNITIKNSVFSDEITVDTGNNIVFDNNTHNNINASTGEPAGRISVYGTGLTVKNSLLQGGDADGIQSGASVNIINNRFIDICQAGPNHTDMVQFYSDYASGLVKGNLFYASPSCSTQGLTSYDSGTNGMVLEDNVVDIHRPWGIEWYSDQNSIIRHNTIVYRPDSECDFTGLVCGQIYIGRKSVDPPGSGTQVYDNIAIVVVTDGSTVARNDHNVSGQNVTYVGPRGVSWANYCLAPGSVGSNAASDGLDVGIRC